MEPLSDDSLNTLQHTVQHNCAISDARHARDYSLCIYLLRMREYFRWDHNLPLLHSVDIDQVGNWVTDRELWWDEIEEQDYQPLHLNGIDFDPYDHKSINQRLIPQGLVYSAGIGRMGQPHFALTTLIDHRVENNIEYFDCGKELARDTVTVPAMAQGRQVFIRRDGIRRLLWEMYDDWCLHRKAGAMAAVVEYFDLRSDETLDAKLNQASHHVASLFEAHERGEVEAGLLLGDDYSSITLSLAGTRAEHHFRATRDLLADTLCTWPLIIEQRSILYLDFWLAGLNGLRLSFLDTCGVHDQLLKGTDDDRLRCLSDLTHTEQQRWRSQCLTLLAAYQNLNHAERLKLDVESLFTVNHNTD
ncbi:MAG: hypothetical protein KTR32_29450 [Granulosicoccus sp.]|nr:hypothetical protein [Granulosicoccus sp.]